MLFVCVLSVHKCFSDTTLFQGMHVLPDDVLDEPAQIRFFFNHTAVIAIMSAICITAGSVAMYYPCLKKATSSLGGSQSKTKKQKIVIAAKTHEDELSDAKVCKNSKIAK